MPKGYPKNPEEANAKRSSTLKKQYENPGYLEVHITARNRPEVKAKQVATLKKHYVDPEAGKKLSISMKKLYKNPGYLEKHIATMNHPEVKIKNRVATRKQWQDPKYVAKQIKANGTRPNRPEKFLDKLLQKMFPNQWKYVGRGDFFVEGTNKNPDFVNTKQKKIIEFFGDFWHGEGRTGIPNKQHEQERIDLFDKEGYQTLIIWEHELEDIDLIIQKLREFTIK